MLKISFCLTENRAWGIIKEIYLKIFCVERLLNMKIIETLMELTKFPGIAGFEDEFVKVACEKLKKYCDNIKITKTGNVVGQIKSKNENAPTIMLEAHLDRIGLIVTSVDENGFVGFDTLGGVDERVLPAAEVYILGKKEVFGIVGAKPPHLMSKEETDEGLKIKDMLIDTGLSGDELKSLVRVGDPILLRSQVVELSKNRVSSAALDNRAGMTVVFDCLEKLKGAELPCNLQIAFARGEELGLQGANTIVGENKPDLAVVLDVTYGRTPDAKDAGTFPLGCGAVICRGPNLHYEMTKKVIETAKIKNIPYEIEVASGSSGTNAWAIQVSGGGVPCVLISIPLKYMHTTVETVDIRDMENVSKLLVEIISGGGVIA